VCSGNFIFNATAQRYGLLKRCWFPFANMSITYVFVLGVLLLCLHRYMNLLFLCLSLINDINPGIVKKFKSHMLIL
jgi:uncharacterized metal-binding protein